MKTLEFEPKREIPKKRRNYFTRLLERQMRKTGADKRREFFGSDPLLVKENSES